MKIDHDFIETSLWGTLECYVCEKRARHICDTCKANVCRGCHDEIQGKTLQEIPNALTVFTFQHRESYRVIKIVAKDDVDARIWLWRMLDLDPIHPDPQRARLHEFEANAWVLKGSEAIGVRI